MPNYTFRDKLNGDQKTLTMTMTIAERDQFVKDHPELEQVLVPIQHGDAIRYGRVKPDDNFRDVLRNVKHHHPLANINTW